MYVSYVYDVLSYVLLSHIRTIMCSPCLNLSLPTNDYDEELSHNVVYFISVSCV